MNQPLQRRLGLLAMALLWLLIAVSHLLMSDAHRWYPDIVGVLALVATILHVALYFWPYWALAYRLGGTFAVGALLFRMASISLGLFMYSDADADWIAVATVSSTLMLVILYGMWWLGPVNRWHNGYVRGRADG